MEFEQFFNNYVQHGMLPDVSREIAAAQRGDGGGNFLCALGLLTYTEVMGRWVPGVSGGSADAFNAFFGRLGPCYASLLDAAATTQKNPYDLYRNGMVHTYLTKAPGMVAMLDGDPPAPCGAFNDANGYHLVIERYFRDFVVACARLHKERLGHRHALIHIWAVDLFPYGGGRRTPSNADLE